ncbi:MULTISPECIES: tetratricopeptide repeat protein [unclassified Microcoleus]|uniref:tetratricopeptide repeat protein n=1 Tax=unclassified Microcoleus TaxID=2642155 RepID=UPI002FD049F6
MPDQPEENFDEAAKKFDIERLRANLVAEKKGEITTAAWRYLKGVLCLGEPKEVANKCYVKEKTVQVALNREIKDHLLKILHLPENQRVDWSSVPGLLAKAGYRLSNHYTNPPQNIPHTGVVEFVGRSRELEKLHQLLQEGNRVAIAAIAGMGGVGKTELAIQYALKHLNNYPGGVCWLPAKNPDMGIEIVRFARSQFDNLNPQEDWDLKTQVDFCWRRWESGEVLVVLDDVTDYGEIKPYLPPVELRFKVLMTTRIKRLGKSIESLLLDVLDEADALKLLIYHIGEERIQQELEEAKKLCAWLEFLPLGLELVGRYLDRKAHLSLAELLQRLEEKRLNERSLCKREEDMTAKRGVKAAFELSWETLNDESKQLGCLLSLFAPAPIPWYLVEQAASAQDPEDLEEIRDDILLNLHLLQRMGDETYRLHQLIREFFWEKLERTDQVKELKQGIVIAMVAVAKPIPGSPTRELIDSLAITVPHLAEVAQTLTDELSDDDLPELFKGLMRFYVGQGLYGKAEYWSKQCLSLVQTRFGTVHPYIAITLENLAYCYEAQGRYSEAEPLYIQASEIWQHLQAIEFWKTLLGADDPDVFARAQDWKNQAGVYINPHVAGNWNNLGVLYLNQGRYEEAESLLLSALQWRLHWFGDKHLDVATSLNNLGVLYSRQGRYSDAELCHQQALELRKHLLGDKHPDVATSLNNLATLYCEQGRYSKAQPLLEQSLELSRHLQGDKHPDV